MFSFSVELLVLGSLILILCKSNHAFRYYAKTIIIYGYTFCASLALIAICICTFRWRNLKNAVTLAVLIRPISRALGINWIVRGREYFEEEGTCIFVANHQSSLDLLGLSELMPTVPNCGVIAKKEIIYFFPYSVAAWLSGVIRIDRSNFEKSRTTLQKTIDEYKTKGFKLLIFPEGHRRNTGEIHQFKKGAFHLAINAQVPICPAVCSRHYFLDKTNKHFDSGNIIITILPPISTQGMTPNDVNELIERTREAMIKVFNETSEEAMNM